MGKFKWVAYCHDWAFEDNSEGTFDSEKECYDDMRNAALEKMKWNTEHDEDFADGTTAIGYEVWFAPNMIVHKSYSGTYLYLIIGASEKCSYFDAFSKERVEQLVSIGYLDSFNVSTIESYRARHEEQIKAKEREDKEKKEREDFCKDIDTKIDEVERYLELKEKVKNYWGYLEESLGEPMWPIDQDWRSEEGCNRMLAVMQSIKGENPYLKTYGDWTADGERDTKDYVREDGKTWGQVWRENLKFFANYFNKNK